MGSEATKSGDHVPDSDSESSEIMSQNKTKHFFLKTKEKKKHIHKPTKQSKKFQVKPSNLENENREGRKQFQNSHYLE